MTNFTGRTFVVRIDGGAVGGTTTFASDLTFLMQRHVRPIVIAPSGDVARACVKSLNRHSNIAVGLSGADAALLPSGGAARMGRVQAGILATLTTAGYLPVIEPTAFGFGGDDIALSADDVASAIATATEAARALFFRSAGGVVDPTSRTLLAELTPAEALALADRDDLDDDLRAMMRAAASGVRGGVGAAQILDGNIDHAAIVELLTEHHLGTQVAGTVYLGSV